MSVCVQPPVALAAQQTDPQANPQTGTALPVAPEPAMPEPKLTEPLYLRDTGTDYTVPRSYFPHVLDPYKPINVPLSTSANAPRLAQLLRDGKLYLGLADAITLALENNYDIEISRINLDIADTDILRARAGVSFLRGVPTGLVANTLGGTTSTITGGGGPGGTSTAAG
ncbi:MAG: TolC family protein, partial [Acidobacteriaceae bacterium]|nr:TolC family protein [Acidobacteriaceae bacterium]